MISSLPSSSFSHSSSTSSISCYPSTSPRLSSKIPCATSPRRWGQLTSPSPTQGEEASVWTVLSKEEPKSENEAPAPSSRLTKNTKGEETRSVLPRGSVIQQNMTKLASIATRSTANQTPNSVTDGRSLQQWRSTQENTGSSFRVFSEQTCDPSRKLPSRSPTVVLEQLRDRIRSISADMHALNKSCSVELANQQRASVATQTSRQTSCSCALPPSPQKGGSALRFHEEYPYSRLTHLQSETSLHLHITNEVWHQERAFVHLTISRSFRLKPGVPHDFCQSSLVPTSLNECARGGYAGVLG